MAGSTLAQMIELDTVGEELIQLGWRQGSVLKVPSAQKSWLVLDISEEDPTNILTSSDLWSLQHETLDTSDLLTIASQTCDIERSPKLEPYVETLRAYWTPERSIKIGRASCRERV